MKNTRILGLSALCSIILFGCASAGTNFDSRKVTEIQKGRTTEADLVGMFGEPKARGIKTGGVKTLSWVYVQSQVKGETFIPFAGAWLGGTDTKTKTLTVSLDDKGTVSDYEYSGSDLSGTGTLQDDPEKK
jgi:hypothetical protein